VLATAATVIASQATEPLAKLFGCREWRRPMGGHKGDVAP